MILGVLTVKVPNKKCNRRHFIFMYFYLLKKIRLDVSCESSARQRIHMCQVLFPLKNNEKVFTNIFVCSYDRGFNSFVLELYKSCKCQIIDSIKYISFE